MPICSSAVTAGSADADAGIRIMRWTFRRSEEIVICELGLNGDHSAYELRVALPWNAFGPTTELFDDAMSAFQRHTALERGLVRDGWSLESFHAIRIPR